MSSQHNQYICTSWVGWCREEIIHRPKMGCLGKIKNSMVVFCTCMIFDPHLTTNHSNMGMHLNKSNQLTHTYRTLECNNSLSPWNGCLMSYEKLWLLGQKQDSHIDNDYLHDTWCRCCRVYLCESKRDYPAYHQHYEAFKRDRGTGGFCEPGGWKSKGEKQEGRKRSLVHATSLLHQAKPKFSKSE